jgi:hypothetical protein
MNTFTESKPLPPDVHTIAFKIDAEPWRDLPTPQAGRGIALSLAFCLLLDFRIKAALGNNMIIPVDSPFRIAPLRSGFFGEITVSDLNKGILTIKRLFDDLQLSAHVEIAFRAYGQAHFQHLSGPTFGPFEDHFVDLHKTVEDMTAIMEKFTVPPP